MEATEEWEDEELTAAPLEDINEGAEYSPKSDFSKAKIAYCQMERCCIIRSEEMRSGYNTHVTDNMGNMKLITLPDTRKKFIGSVIALKNLMMPEILRDARMKEVNKQYESHCENLKKKYAYIEKEFIIVNGEYKSKLTGREYVPEIGEILVAGLKPTGKGIMGEDRIEGFWDSKVNAYYNELLDLHDDLFAELNILVYKLNYFKQGVSF
jgi:hypothetical protein